MYKLKFFLRDYDARRRLPFVLEDMGSLDCFPENNLWTLLVDAVMSEDVRLSGIAEAICFAAVKNPGVPDPRPAEVYGTDCGKVAFETPGGVVIAICKSDLSGLDIYIDFGRNSKNLSKSIVRRLGIYGIKYSYISGMEDSSPYIDMPTNN